MTSGMLIQQCSQGEESQSPEQHAATCAGNTVIAEHAMPFQVRVFELHEGINNNQRGTSMGLINCFN